MRTVLALSSWSVTPQSPQQCIVATIAIRTYTYVDKCESIVSSRKLRTNGRELEAERSTLTSLSCICTHIPPSLPPSFPPSLPPSLPPLLPPSPPLSCLGIIVSGGRDGCLCVWDLRYRPKSCGKYTTAERCLVTSHTPIRFTYHCSLYVLVKFSPL